MADDKYDAFLLDNVKAIGSDVKDLIKEQAKQGVELKANTDSTKKLETEVRETNGSVKTLQGEVIELKKVVFPEAPITAKNLVPFYRDPIILKILLYFSLSILLLVAAATQFDVKGIITP